MRVSPRRLCDNHNPSAATEGWRAAPAVVGAAHASGQVDVAIVGAGPYRLSSAAFLRDTGVGGQTPIFHAVTQNEDQGLPVARVLVDRGADLSIRVKIPGHYERPEELVECTPFGYALTFENEPGRADKVKTVAFLRGLRAPE